jgi:molybdopterin molybdotransferase
MEIITFEKATEIVLNSSFITATEKISFIHSLDRVLADEVMSDMDMPPFNKASVDGFACRKSELGNELEIIETIPAGKWPEKSIGKQQCSRIMTGAVVPSGAECVFMVEDSEILPSGKVRFKGSFTKENIALKGEDIKKGDVVLKAGKQIRPQDIAVMATVGCTTLVVSRMPRVAVISSGDELVEPDERPDDSQIRNSNAYQLMAQVERAGATGKYYGIARDDEEETFSMVQMAISESDIVLLTGGVSMGDFDFVPSVLEKAGVRIIFSQIAIHPGKPTAFGIHPRALVFGLPGNPVSSFVMFELLVRPLLSKMMGNKWQPVSRLLPMKEGFSRKYAERMAWIPVRVTSDGLVSPVEFHGSAHISALPEADGLIAMQVGIKTLTEGEIVNVRQI